MGSGFLERLKYFDNCSLAFLSDNLCFIVFHLAGLMKSIFNGRTIILIISMNNKYIIKVMVIFYLFFFSNIKTEELYAV